MLYNHNGGIKTKFASSKKIQVGNTIVAIFHDSLIENEYRDPVGTLPWLNNGKFVICSLLFQQSPSPVAVAFWKCHLICVDSWKILDTWFIPLQAYLSSVRSDWALRFPLNGVLSAASIQLGDASLWYHWTKVHIFLNGKWYLPRIYRYDLIFCYLELSRGLCLKPDPYNTSNLYLLEYWFIAAHFR